MKKPIRRISDRISILYSYLNINKMYLINFFFSGIGFKFCYRICGKNIMKPNLTTNEFLIGGIMDTVLSDSQE